jgi:hypothetical protein
VFAGGYVVLGVVVGGALAAAGRTRSSPAIERVARTQLLVPIGVSVVALAGAYVCTPDTEMARLFLGGVVGAGVVSVAVAMPWRVQADAATALVVLIALFDGWGRGSAVVGTLATAVVHGVAQAALQRNRRPRYVPVTRAPGVQVLVLVVAGIATAVTSRVAGLADSVSVALAISAVAVGAAALVLAPSKTLSG